METSSIEIFSTPTYEVTMKNIATKLIERESHPSKVGPRITAMRETLGKTKAELADSISFSRSTLTKVEKGEAGLDIAVGERIADSYGFGLDFIYRGDLDDVPHTLRESLVKNLNKARSA